MNEVSTGWFEKLRIGETSIEFKLDSGADVNCIPLIEIEKLNFENEIIKSNNSLYSYTNNNFKTFGQIKLPCIHKNHQYIIEFEVVDSNLKPILSRDTCVDLGLIKRVYEVNGRFAGLPKDKETFVLQNKNLFEGLGKLPGTCKIMLKPNSIPVLKYRKRIPDSLHEPLKLLLEEMRKDKIISVVDYPTEWVNNLQIVEKPNKALRICLDPIPLNECIQREHYQIPTAEEIFSRLKNKSIFTVLDLKNGFWQVELDKESSDLTTFMTPFGRFKWNRMPFGINSAPEIFIKKMIQQFGHIDGVEIYFDDMFIGGVDDADHDRALGEVIEIANRHQIKFNDTKIQYRQKSVKFMGQIISKGSVSPDEKYLEAIKNFPRPKDKADVMRLLGMYKYLARYIPNLSQRTAQLRELTKINSEWIWGMEQEKEFKE